MLNSNIIENLPFVTFSFKHSLKYKTHFTDTGNLLHKWNFMEWIL